VSKILIADDDVHLLRVMTIWLSRSGYDVLQARDGSEAIDAFREHRPPLVITDVNMPGMDGLEVARRMLAEATHPLGIIVLSCRCDVIGVSQMLGSDNVLHHGKPFSPSRLIADVRSLEARLSGSAPVEQRTREGVGARRG
jgi:two-component system response regulator MtrA